MPSKLPETKLYIIHEQERVCQGDIFRGIELPIAVSKNGQDYTFDTYLIEYAVIVSQDCDLQQDYTNHISEKVEKHDKYIPSIILAPAYLAESLRSGEHLSEKGQRMESYNSKLWTSIEKNNNYRYHYLHSDSDRQINSLVIDFKHFFTISRDLFYSVYNNRHHYLASLAPLFRENLTDRFFHYLARIGLPETDRIKM
jgi:hypothetical protein